MADGRHPEKLKMSISRQRLHRSTQLGTMTHVDPPNPMGS